MDTRRSSKRTEILIMGMSIFFFLGMSKIQVSTLTVGKVKGIPGDKVNVEVRLSAQRREVSSINFDLVYNGSALKVTDVVAGPVLENTGKMVSYNKLSPGIIRVVIFGVNQGAIADGDIVNVKFKIESAAEAGNIPLKLRDISASSPNAKKVIIKGVDGLIRVK